MKTTIWCSYYLDEHINDYNLKETNTVKLFNTRDLTYKYDNINYLSDYLSELSLFYYVWKNNLKSDIVGFDQYRRHFPIINYNEINNNKIQIYTKWNIDESYYTYLLNCRVNDYILTSLKYFILKNYSISKKDLDNILFNESYSTNVFMILMFICKWDIFCKMCEFMFGFLDYLFPNEQWKDKQTIIDFLDDMIAIEHQNDYYNTIRFGEHEYEYWSFPYRKRFIAHFMEAILIVFCKLYNYDIFSEECHFTHNLYYKTDKNFSIKKLFNIHNKNMWNNYQKLIVDTDDEKIKKEILDNKGWYTLERVEFGSKQNNSIELSDNQYIDVDDPYNIKKITIKTIDK